MDRLVETDSNSMVKAYETRIKKFETDRAVLVEKSGQSLRPMRSFDAALRTADTPLPFKVLGGLTNKRILLAEREGFEPSVRFEPYARFPGVYLKPLGHLSEYKITYRNRQGAQRINQNSVSGNFSGIIKD